MEKLNFELFTDYDTARWLYRGVISCAVFQAFRKYNISKVSKDALVFIEKELWKPKNTFISMRTNFRYNYSIVLASVLWYAIKQGYYSGVDLWYKSASQSNENITMSPCQMMSSYKHSMVLGSLTSSIIWAATLTYNPQFLLVTTLAGASLGIVHCLTYRSTLRRNYGYMMQEDLFVEDIY